MTQITINKIKRDILKIQFMFLFAALLFIVFGTLFTSGFTPEKWMTYRNFDVEGEKNFINYLSPGVTDVSTGTYYDFDNPKIILLLLVLFMFFPLMLGLRLLLDIDLKLGIYRWFTQWAVFVTARLGIFRVAGVCPVKRSSFGVFPFINCQSCELATGACPLGTFQMSMVNRQIPISLIGQIILVGIFSGRWVCGWLCPYGFLSDLFDKIPGKRLRHPLKAVYIKYFVIGILIISSVIYFIKGETTSLLYCSLICPAGFYYGVLEYALTTGLHSVIEEFPYIHYMLVYHFLMGVAVIIGSAKLGGRFFCKFVCPLGALYGLFNKISFYRIRVNSNRCTGCKKCSEVCPMHISILDHSLFSRSNCIMCGRCAKVCPNDKIEFTFGLNNLSVTDVMKRKQKPVKVNIDKKLKQHFLSNAAKNK